MKKKQGFTLIELLVVIAIIAILAAILFPVFAKVREKARQTSCLSNLKQIGLGLTQYNQDFDERGPCGSSQWGTGSGWTWQVYPYIKSVNLFHCPDDSGVGSMASSYAMNGNVTTGNGTVGSNVGLSIADYFAPAKTVMLFEIVNSKWYDLSRGDGVWSNGNNADNMWNGGSPVGYGKGTGNDPNGGNIANNGGADNVQSGTVNGSNTGNVKYATGVLKNATVLDAFQAQTGRHNDGANYLMADNHAKFFRPSQVCAGHSNNWHGCVTGTFNWAADSTECNDGTAAVTFSTL